MPIFRRVIIEVAYQQNIKRNKPAEIVEHEKSLSSHVYLRIHQAWAEEDAEDEVDEMSQPDWNEVYSPGNVQYIIHQASCKNHEA